MISLTNHHLWVSVVVRSTNSTANCQGSFHSWLEGLCLGVIPTTRPTCWSRHKQQYSTICNNIQQSSVIRCVWNHLVLYSSIIPHLPFSKTWPCESPPVLKPPPSNSITAWRASSSFLPPALEMAPSTPPPPRPRTSPRDGWDDGSEHIRINSIKPSYPKK